MKTTRLITTMAFTFLMLLSFNVGAQEFQDLDKSPMDAASYPTSYKESNKLIKITYSRPQLKGRKVDELTPKDKVWRAGANEAAELTLYEDMMLGENKVAAGTYTFYLIPGEKEWTAIISKDLNVWEVIFYNEDNDVARVTVPIAEGKESLEAFSIAFDKSEDGLAMHLGWGTVRLAVPFSM